MGCTVSSSRHEAVVGERLLLRRQVFADDRLGPRILLLRLLIANLKSLPVAFHQCTCEQTSLASSIEDAAASDEMARVDIERWLPGWASADSTTQPVEG